MSGKLHVLCVNPKENHMVDISTSEPSFKDIRDALGGDAEHVTCRYKNIERHAYILEEVYELDPDLTQNAQATTLLSHYYKRDKGVLGNMVIWVPDSSPSETENTVPVPGVEFNEDPFLSDVEADADVLRNAGWGTD